MAEAVAVPTLSVPLGREMDYPSTYWRSLFYFNTYRLAVAALLLASTIVVGQNLLFGSWNKPLFLSVSVAYALFAAASFITISAHRPGFQLQIAMQVCADIVFVVLLLHASGGISSGLGLLLLANLAAAGIISRGRLTLFYASLAAVAVVGVALGAYGLLRGRSRSAAAGAA